MKLELDEWQIDEYLIKAITLEDASCFYQIITSSEVSNTLSVIPTSIQDAKYMIQVVHLSYRQKVLPQTMVISFKNQMIGLLHVSRMEEGLMEIGYFLDPHYFQKGIMKKVLPTWLNRLAKQFQIHRFEAYCDIHNKASIALLECCGFHYEGCLKALRKTNNGNYCDMYLYAKIIHFK